MSLFRPSSIHFHPLAAHLARGFVLVAVGSLLAACVNLPPLQTDEERAKAAKEEQARQAARPKTVCSAKQGNPFAMRKKVVVLALPVLRPEQAGDLPDLASAWSSALQERLLNSDRFLVRDGSRYSIDANGNTRKQVVSLAQMYDAQIVIAGQIASLAAGSARVPLGPLGSVAQPLGEVRPIEVKLDLYDGQTGAQLGRLSHAGEARGDVLNRDHAPLRGGFFATQLGEAVARLLDQQTEAVEDELACLPLLARAVQTQGDEARIDAGFTSNIKPGDRMRVVQPQGFPSADGSQVEKSFGTLAIKQVFPESAIGQFQGEAPPDWRYGVYVRAW